MIEIHSSGRDPIEDCEGGVVTLALELWHTDFGDEIHFKRVRIVTSVNFRIL